MDILTLPCNLGERACSASMSRRPPQCQGKVVGP
jgi:hypothetical protein